MKRWLYYLSLAAIIGANLRGVSAEVPQANQLDYQIFEAYPVKQLYKGAPAKPVIATPAARLFRTQIRRGAARGPVFADHYAVASWGCGTGCTSFAIIDSVTGRVYIPPFYVVQSREDGYNLHYVRGSRAIHIIGELNEQEPSVDRWYEWSGRELKIISEKPAKNAP